MSTIKVDRPMLELAAKAATYNVKWCLNGVEADERLCFVFVDTGERWEPQDDDGDALRLAAALGFSTGFDDRFSELGACAYCTYPTGDFSCNSVFQNIDAAGGKQAAMRHAIVRAYAAVGQAMP